MPTDLTSQITHKSSLWAHGGQSCLGCSYTIHQGKNQDNIIDYTCATYTYTINNLYDANEHVSTITIKGKDPTCNVVTHCSNIALPGAPSRAAYVPKHYNLVDQLDKMSVLISILELLCISPSYKTILDQALQEASLPPDLNIDQFQAMVGSLKLSPCLTFGRMMMQPFNNCITPLSTLRDSYINTQSNKS